MCNCIFIIVPKGYRLVALFYPPLVRQRIVYRRAGLHLTVTVKVAINVSGRADIRVAEPHLNILHLLALREYKQGFERSEQNNLNGCFGTVTEDFCPTQQKRKSEVSGKNQERLPSSILFREKVNQL